MAASYQLTPRALDNLDEIWIFIAQDKISAADRVEAAILSACYRLARHPLLGTKRTEITGKPVRFWTVPRYPNYIVVYRPETRPLQVVAIVHGMRNLKQLLDEPGAF
jgi:plasmid stabilization system protein ParE